MDEALRTNHTPSSQAGIPTPHLQERTKNRPTATGTRCSPDQLHLQEAVQPAVACRESQHTSPIPKSILAGCANRKDADQYVRKLAEDRFNGDPAIASQRAKQTAELAELDAMLPDLELNCECKRSQLKGVNPFTTSRASGATGFAVLKRVWIPALGLLLVLAASVQNGLYFVTHSSFPISSIFEALGLTVIFSLAPAILSKWYFSGRNDAWRNGKESKLKLAALLLSGLGLLGFSYVFGVELETVDLFAGPEAMPWRLPLWSLLFVSMLLEALASMALVASIVAEMRVVVPEVSIDAPLYVSRYHSLLEDNAKMGRLKAQKAAHLGWLAANDSRREQYVAECLAQLRLVQAHMRCELEQVESKRLAEATAARHRFLSVLGTAG